MAATYPANTFKESVDLTIEAANKIAQVVRGDANTEVTVADGSTIPSIRKAQADSMYFKEPEAWTTGQTETDYLQLKKYTDPTTNKESWWFAKGALVSNPIAMGTSPFGDDNWTLYTPEDLFISGKAEYESIYQALKGKAAEAGYNLVRGSFEEGGTLTNTNDVLWYQSNGRYYSWKGSLPKVVPAGSTPATSGGIGAGAWVDRTDVTLRSEIREYVNQAQEEIINGKIFPESGVLSNGMTVTAGTTHLRVLVSGEPTILIAWDTLILPATVTAVPVSDNGFSGYDVVTDQGTFEFVTQEINSLRGRNAYPTASKEVYAIGFGVVADGVTDDYASLRRAGDYCRDNGISKLILPHGKIRLSQYYEVDWQANIEGQKGTVIDSDEFGTTLLFDDGLDGLKVVRAANSASGGAGDDSVIKCVNVECAGDNSNSSGHGVTLFARAFCEDVVTQNFGEDGFHIVATSSSNSDNANLFTLIRCKATQNGRDGLFVSGADVNAGETIGFNSTYNGRFNVNDSSFLGNTHIGAHSSNPARRAYGRGSDGQGYRCILDHVATADTIPVTGADWETYWELWAASTTYPDIVVDTKYYDSRNGESGDYPFYHYFSAGSNSINVFVGCYAEGADGASNGGSYISNRSQIYGGLLGEVEPKGFGQAYRANISPVKAVTYKNDSVVTSGLGDPDGTLAAAFTFKEDVPDVQWALRWDPSNATWDLRAGGLIANRTFFLCDSGNSLGRTVGFLDFSSMGCGIGGKRHSASSSAPTNGEYQRGDIIYRTTPSASGKIGWVTTVGGKAGSTAVFKEFGAIDA